MRARHVLVLGAFLFFEAASVAQAAPKLETMAGLGLGKATGDGSEEVDHGLGLLLGVGARLSPWTSLRGQLNVDRPRPDTMEFDGDLSYWILRAQIVPAFHLGNDKVDFGIGPTLGLFLLRFRGDATIFGDKYELKAAARGYTIGAQAWMMARVSPRVSLGPVFSYGRLWATNVCLKATGVPEECDRSPENDGEDGYWNLSVAALFD